MRAFVGGVLIIYAVLAVVYFVCVEYLDLLGDQRMTTLMMEVLISLGALLLVIFLIVLRARLLTISFVKRHCNNLTRRVCPRLTLRCNLPFFQFTGGIARGWYIAVSRKRETA